MPFGSVQRFALAVLTATLIIFLGSATPAGAQPKGAPRADGTCVPAAELTNLRVVTATHRYRAIVSGGLVRRVLTSSVLDVRATAKADTCPDGVSRPETTTLRHTYTRTNTQVVGAGPGQSAAPTRSRTGRWAGANKRAVASARQAGRAANLKAALDAAREAALTEAKALSSGSDGTGDAGDSGSADDAMSPTSPTAATKVTPGVPQAVVANPPITAPPPAAADDSVLSQALLEEELRAEINRVRVANGVPTAPAFTTVLPYSRAWSDKLLADYRSAGNWVLVHDTLRASGVTELSTPGACTSTGTLWEALVAATVYVPPTDTPRTVAQNLAKLSVELWMTSTTGHRGIVLRNDVAGVRQAPGVSYQVQDNGMISMVATLKMTSAICPTLP